MESEEEDKLLKKVLNNDFGFIARIKVGNRYETISMHPTYEEAEKVYLTNKNK